MKMLQCAFCRKGKVPEVDVHGSSPLCGTCADAYWREFKTTKGIAYPVPSRAVYSLYDKG